MHLTTSGPPLWPLLTTLVALCGIIVALVMRKVSVRVGAPLAVLSLVLALASLFVSRGEVTVESEWSLEELRRPSLDAADVPYSDEQLEQARIKAYENLASFSNLVPFWAKEQRLTSDTGSLSTTALRVSATPTGVKLTASVPLLSSLLEEKPQTLLSGFMQDLVHPQCQRNIVINELRRNAVATPEGGSAKVEYLARGHCFAWAEAGFGVGLVATH